jgi:hypothetical protein
MIKTDVTCRMLFLTLIVFFMPHASIQSQTPSKTKNIKIIFRDYSIEAEIFDTPTGKVIYESLPLESYVRTWGEEIYFEVPFKIRLEKEAKTRVRVGDLAYWPDGPAFCIFFGPTPATYGQQPVAASAVNVFGRLKAVNKKFLRRILRGDIVRVESVNP